LTYRLRGIANEKEAVSTKLFPCKNETKEIIKVRLTKFTHRIDTESQFAHLQGFLGIPGITIGLHMPRLKAHDEFGCSSQCATIGDTSICFSPPGRIG
jgi:hypothetical protein